MTVSQGATTGHRSRRWPCKKPCRNAVNTALRRSVQRPVRPAGPRSFRLRTRPRGSADRAAAGRETLVPVVLALAEKRLEVAQPVGGSVAGIRDVKLEILAKVAKAAKHLGGRDRLRGDARGQIGD